MKLALLPPARHRLISLGPCLGLLLAGCATSLPPGPVSIGSRPANPHATGNADLSKVKSVEGLIYQIDDQVLLLRSPTSALRFALPSGKRSGDLHPGDLVRVHISYKAQGMAVESLELLPNPHGAYPPVEGLPAHAKVTNNDNRSKKGDNKDHEQTKP